MSLMCGTTLAIRAIIPPLVNCAVRRWPRRFLAVTLVCVQNGLKHEGNTGVRRMGVGVDPDCHNAIHCLEAQVPPGKQSHGRCLGQLLRR